MEANEETMAAMSAAKPTHVDLEASKSLKRHKSSQAWLEALPYPAGHFAPATKQRCRE